MKLKQTKTKETPTRRALLALLALLAMLVALTTQVISCHGHLPPQNKTSRPLAFVFTEINDEAPNHLELSQIEVDAYNNHIEEINAVWQTAYAALASQPRKNLQHAYLVLQSLKLEQIFPPGTLAALKKVSQQAREAHETEKAAYRAFTQHLTSWVFLFDSIGLGIVLGNADASSVWPRDTPIRVCWENQTHSDDISQERLWVEDAVSSTWEAAGNVSFYGWQPCRNDRAEQIRVQVSDDVPYTRGLGTQIIGKENGVVLNFKFKNYNEKCASPELREMCIRAVALHEFGHVLGLAHEDARPDTPDTCEFRSREAPGNMRIGDWDEDSIMNYCQADWPQRALLSDGDIEAAANLYGSRPTLSDDNQIRNNLILAMSLLEDQAQSKKEKNPEEPIPTEEP